MVNLTKDSAQSEKFKAAARELGCDDDEAAFDDNLRKTANAKTNHEPEKVKKSGQSA